MSARQARDRELYLLDLAEHVGQNNDAFRGGRAKLKSFFVNETRRLLAEGVDPNATDAHGKHAFILLGAVGLRFCRASHSIAKAFIDHEFDLIDSGALTWANGPLFIETMQHLERRSKLGKPVVGANGDNALHFLMERSQIQACEWLNERDEPGARTVVKIEASLVQSTRHDGATPLHLLWKPQAMARSKLQAQERWAAMRCMAEAGADIQALDCSGASVLDLVEQAIRQGHPLQLGEGTDARDRAYAAQMEQLLLERKTAGAAGQSRPTVGMRL